MWPGQAAWGIPVSYLFTSQRELPQFEYLEAKPLSEALGAAGRRLTPGSARVRPGARSSLRFRKPFSASFFRERLRQGCRSRGHKNVLAGVFRKKVAEKGGIRT